MKTSWIKRNIADSAYINARLPPSCGFSEKRQQNSSITIVITIIIIIIIVVFIIIKDNNNSGSNYSRAMINENFLRLPVKIAHFYEVVMLFHPQCLHNLRQHWGPADLDKNLMRAYLDLSRFQTMWTKSVNKPYEPMIAHYCGSS